GKTLLVKVARKTKCHNVDYGTTNDLVYFEGDRHDRVDQANQTTGKRSANNRQEQVTGPYVKQVAQKCRQKHHAFDTNVGNARTLTHQTCQSTQNNWGRLSQS